MKDTKDKATINAFAAKKRGRPSTGNALTPLERKNTSIAKRKIDFENANVPAYKECSTAYLMEYLFFLIEKKYHSPAKLVANELANRAK